MTNAAKHRPGMLDGDRWTRRVGLGCFVVVLIVGLMDVVFYYLGWFPSEIVARSFDVGREESIGTWVSSSLALGAGVVGLLLAGVTRERSGGEWLGWVAVGLFFIYVSMDDAAKIHERLGSASEIRFEALTDSDVSSWFPSWGWQLFVAPLFGAVGIGLAWFLWRVVPRGVFRYVLLGFGAFAVAVAIDFVEGVIYLNVKEVPHPMRLVEELIEMAGTGALLYAFVATLSARVTVAVSRKP